MDGDVRARVCMDRAFDFLEALSFSRSTRKRLLKHEVVRDHR